MEEIKAIERSITESREAYRGVSKMASLLYFISFSISNIDQMYLNSLQYYKKIFRFTIKNTVVK